jgi:alpha-L-fucosidase 2
MFDAHPPFQIDGNFGFTSGIAEMLLQSQDGSVHLLPALPQAWPEGEVKGLVARGGYIVDIRWQKNQLTYLKVTSRLGGNLRLRSYVPLPEPHDFKQKNAIGENKNRFYQLPTTKPVLKNTRLNLPKISLADSFLIDVVTTPGQSYVWGQ